MVQPATFLLKVNKNTEQMIPQTTKIFQNIQFITEIVKLQKYIVVFPLILHDYTCAMVSGQEEFSGPALMVLL